MHEIEYAVAIERTVADIQGVLHHLEWPEEQRTQLHVAASLLESRMLELQRIAQQKMKARS